VELGSFPDPQRFMVTARVICQDSSERLPGDATLVWQGAADTMCAGLVNGELILSSPVRSGDYSFLATAKGYEPVGERIHLAIDDRNSIWNLLLALRKISVPVQGENRTESRELFLLRDIYFTFESCTVPASSISYLDSLVQFLNHYPLLHLTLTGYADAQGPDGYNLQLSQKRAGMVGQYLTEKGIEAGRISAEGKGKADPVALDLNPESRKWNRRVTFSLSATDAVEIRYLPSPVPARYKLK
jgi:outer membrane protein OmpA-like peptidoglycan-associated protein